jgi:hypothetical protein
MESSSISYYSHSNIIKAVSLTGNNNVTTKSYIMTPLLLFQNACIDIMSIKITNVTVSNETIQYSYTQSDGSTKYFLRICRFRLINGYIGKDDKSYASGLPIEVIRYLIDNFHKVNFYEMSE